MKNTFNVSSNALVRSACNVTLFINLNKNFFFAANYSKKSATYVKILFHVIFWKDCVLVHAIINLAHIKTNNKQTSEINFRKPQK